MNYLVGLLGNVAQSGLRADQAAQALVERTVDEFSLLVCQKTGMSFDFLTRLKGDVLQKVYQGTFTEPVQCQGKTKNGIPCKKRTVMGYCHEHMHQETVMASKKRRVEAHMAVLHAPHNPKTLNPMITSARYRFA